MADTVYLKIGKSVEVDKNHVTLGDVAGIFSTKADIAAKVSTIKIVNMTGQKRKRYVISILPIIQEIHQMYPTVQVENLGEIDFVVEQKSDKNNQKVLEWIKTILVWAILFLGSAFAIMSFNNDVSIDKMFKDFYEKLVGSSSSGFTVLEISYSIGIFVGISVFYNHFGPHKLSTDPTPMEVEMRQYEDDINMTLVQNSDRNKEHGNVD